MILFSSTYDSANSRNEIRLNPALQTSSPPLIRTAHYSGQLLCPWGKKALTFSLNSIRSIRAPRLLSLRVRVNHLIIFFCPPPSPSVRINGVWQNNKKLVWRKESQTLLSSGGSREGCPGAEKMFLVTASPPLISRSGSINQLHLNTVNGWASWFSRHAVW